MNRPAGQNQESSLRKCMFRLEVIFPQLSAYFHDDLLISKNMIVMAPLIRTSTFTALFYRTIMMLNEINLELQV